MTHWILKSAACLAIAMLLQPAFGVTYYIAAAASGGNDANSGLIGNPWLTFAKATNIATSPILTGDTVLLNRGDTWFECFTHPTNYTTLSYYGTGPAPVINGGGIQDACVATAKAGTITEGLVLTNGGATLYSCGAFTNYILNCVVMKAGFDGISGGNGSLTVASNCFISSVGDDGFTLHDTSLGLVEYSIFTNNASGINNSGTSMALTVNNCVFINNVGFDVGPLNLCTSVFTRCIWRGRIGGGGSLSLYGPSGDDTTTFNYCLFDATPFAGSSATPEFGCATNTYLNNCTFVGSSNGRFIIGAGTTYATNCIFKGWWKLAEFFGGTFVADHCIFNSITTSNATTVTSFVSGADPQFISSSDFRLQSTSPAINAGVYIGLTSDLAGNAVSNPPEVGAYEFPGVKLSISGKAEISGKVKTQ